MACKSDRPTKNVAGVDCGGGRQRTEGECGRHKTQTVAQTTPRQGLLAESVGHVRGDAEFIKRKREGERVLRGRIGK